MISRIASLCLLLYALGFILFAFTLGKPAPAGAQPTDAAVVLTGGSGRLEHGIDELRDRQGQAAAGRRRRSVGHQARSRGASSRKRHLLKCCVDLGSESVDTRSNAEEAARWLAKHNFHSLRLITSDWHMRRARYEFSRVLKDKYSILPDAVRTEPSFITLFGEYNKYLLRRVAVWADI